MVRQEIVTQTPLPQCQTAFGLQVASPFALSGAGPARSGPPDLTIIGGPAILPEGAEILPPYRRIGRQLELAIPNIGRFALVGPSRLEVAAAPDVDPAGLVPYLIASGLPMLLWQRGGLLIHASGVLIERAGLAITGPSGAGKSTLAKAMIDGGGQLIGDDSLWLPDHSGEVRGLGGGQFLREPDGGEPQFHPLPVDRQAGAAPLRALLVLAPELPDGELRQLDRLAALQAILRARHRPRIPALLGREAAVLAQSADLAASLPVYRLGYAARQIDRAIAAAQLLARQVAGG